MIDVIKKLANLIPFEKVAVGDVFEKDGATYIKTCTVFTRLDLVSYLEYDVLDNVEELGYDGYNAVALEMGVFASFDDETLVMPVKKATLTLDY